MGRLPSSAQLCSVLSLVASTLSSSSPHVASARAISRSFVMTQPGLDFQELASGRASSATDSACDDDSTRVRDTSYSVLAVIGSQGSGKSTLMNAAFGTSFSVKESAFGAPGVEASTRRRKSQCAWLDLWNNSHAIDYRLVLMDMESTSRIQHLNSNSSLDARTILIALALADVIVINVGARTFLDQAVGDDDAIDGFDPAVLALAFEHFASTTASGTRASSSSSSSIRNGKRNGGVRGALGGVGRALGSLQRWRPQPLRLLKRNRSEICRNESTPTVPSAFPVIPRKHIAVVLRDVEDGPDGGHAFARAAAELWKRLCLAAGSTNSLGTYTPSSETAKEGVAGKETADREDHTDWTQAHLLPGGSKWQNTCQFTVSFHALPNGTSGPTAFASSTLDLRDTLLSFLAATRSSDADQIDNASDTSHGQTKHKSEMSHERVAGSVNDDENMKSISGQQRQPRVPLGEFGLFTEALWDSIGARNEGAAEFRGTSRSSSSSSRSSADLSSKAAHRQRCLNLGQVQDKESYLGASLASLCLAPLLLQVSALDDKVSASATAVDYRTGPPCLEFGSSVRKIMSQADTAMQNLATEMGLITVGAPVSTTSSGAAASPALAASATQVAPVVAMAADCLRSDVQRCLEPTRARYLASCAAYAVLAFDDEFSSLLCVPGLPSGKGSDFALRADALIAEALATFDAAAAAVELAPEDEGKVVNRKQRHSGSSRSSARAALLEELQAKVADRRAEGSAFSSASDDEDDEVDDSGRASSGKRALARKGLRGAWAKLPRRWKVLLSRALPLMVNWVQSMHTLVSRRRAAQRQDAILPVMPLF